MKKFIAQFLIVVILAGIVPWQINKALADEFDIINIQTINKIGRVIEEDTPLTSYFDESYEKDRLEKLSKIEIIDLLTVQKSGSEIKDYWYKVIYDPSLKQEVGYIHYDKVERIDELMEDRKYVFNNEIYTNISINTNYAEPYTATPYFGLQAKTREYPNSLTTTSDEFNFQTKIYSYAKIAIEPNLSNEIGFIQHLVTYRNSRGVPKIAFMNGAVLSSRKDEIFPGMSLREIDIRTDDGSCPFSETQCNALRNRARELLLVDGLKPFAFADPTCDSRINQIQVSQKDSIENKSDNIIAIYGNIVLVYNSNKQEVFAMPLTIYDIWSFAGEDSTLGLPVSDTSFTGKISDYSSLLLAEAYNRDCTTLNQATAGDTNWKWDGGTKDDFYQRDQELESGHILTNSEDHDKLIECEDGSFALIGKESWYDDLLGNSIWWEAFNTKTCSREISSLEQEEEWFKKYDSTAYWSFTVAKELTISLLTDKGLGLIVGSIGKIQKLDLLLKYFSPAKIKKLKTIGLFALGTYHTGTAINKLLDEDEWEKIAAGDPEAFADMFITLTGTVDFYHQLAKNAGSYQSDIASIESAFEGKDISNITVHDALSKYGDSLSAEARSQILSSINTRTINLNSADEILNYKLIKIKPNTIDLKAEEVDQMITLFDNISDASQVGEITDDILTEITKNVFETSNDSDDPDKLTLNECTSNNCFLYDQGKTKRVYKTTTVASNINLVASNETSLLAIENTTPIYSVISGEILDQDNELLKNTVIELSNVEKSYADRIDLYGTSSYQIFNLPLTGYNLKFSKRGYGSHHQQAWLYEGGVTERDITTILKIEQETEPPTINEFSVIQRLNSTTPLNTNHTYTLHFKAIDNQVIDQSSFYYSLDNGQTWNIIEESLAYDNSISTIDWPIPTTAISDQAKLKVVISDLAGNTTEALWPAEGTFEIVNGIPPEVNFASPQAGEIWNLGETKKISWQVEANRNMKKANLYFISPETPNQYKIGETVGNVFEYDWPIDLNTRFISDQAQIKMEAWDENENRINLFSEPFTIQDNSTLPENWTEPQQITTVPATTALAKNHTHPVALTDQNGNIHLAYLYKQVNSDNKQITSIYYQKYTTNNQQWSAPQIVNGAGGVYHKQYQSLQASLDQNGKMHLITDLFDPNSNNYEVNYFTNENGSWTKTNLANSTPFVFGSNIAVDSAHTVHVTWEQNGLNYQKKENGTWSQTEKITDEDESANHSKLAVDHKNLVHVAYNQTQDGIFYRSGTSGNWSDRQKISSSPGTFTDLKIDNSNVPHLVWAASGRPFQIYYNHKRQGLFQSEPIVIAPAGENDYFTLPKIQIDSAETPYVTYQDGEQNLYLIRKTLSGWTEPLNLTPATHNNEQDNFVLDNHNHKIYVIWNSSQSSHKEIFYTSSTINPLDITPPADATDFQLEQNLPQATLSWTPSRSSDFSFHKLYQRADATSDWEFVADLPADTNTYTIENHAENNQYKITAISTSGEETLGNVWMKEFLAEENLRPEAKAGNDQRTIPGQKITLNGSLSSDPNNDQLTFSWEQQKGPTVILENPDSMNSSFTPSEGGEYEFVLTVSDGELEDNDVVTVLVTYTDRQILDLKFNGNLTDSSGLDNNAESLPYSDNTPNFVWGRGSTALDFNGSRKFLKIPHSYTNSVAGSPKLSFGAWIYKPENYNGGGNIIRNKEYELFSSGCKIHTGHNFVNLKSQDPLKDNEWRFIFCNYDGKKARLYINGIIHDEVNATGGIVDNENEIQIGADPVNYNSHYGGNNPPGPIIENSTNALIDDISLYTKSFSPVEVWQMYQENDNIQEHPLYGTCSDPNPTPISQLGEHLPSGKLLHYDFDNDTPGLAFDLSSKEHHGEIKNSSHTQSPWGKSLVFSEGTTFGNPDNSTISVNMENLLENSPRFSIGTWFYPEGTSGILFNQRSFHNTFMNASHNDEDGLMFFVDNPAGGGTSIESEAGVIQKNTWNHMVIVANRHEDTMNLYINNVLVNATVQNNGYSINSQYPLIIGARFLGKMDDFRVYNKVLTAEEINEWYNLPQYTQTGIYECLDQPVQPTNNELFFSFDEGTGTQTKDQNNISYNLNGPTWVEGVQGNALKFDGVDDALTITNPDIALDQEVSITFWQYGADAQPASDSIIEAKDSNNNRILNIHLPWSNSKIYWDAGGPDGYDRIYKDALSEEFKGQWNHWAFIKNATSGEMKIYLNGNLWHSGTGLTKSIPRIAKLSIGSYANGDAAYYHGKIDEFKIYNQELTEDEIKTEYETNKPAPNPNQLVSFYSFNEEDTSDTIFEESMHDLHGNIYGEPKRNGKTFVLDGLDDYVHVPDNQIQSITDESISFGAWIKPQDVGQTAYILQKGSGIWWTDLSYAIYLGGQKPGIYMQFGDTKTDTYLTGDKILENDTWYHVYGTYDGSQMRVYVNGELVGEHEASGPVHDSGHPIGLQIGAFSLSHNDDGLAPKYFFKGEIDDVKIFDKVLTSDQLKADFQANKPGLEISPFTVLRTLVTDSFENGIEAWDQGLISGNYDLVDEGFNDNSGVKLTFTPDTNSSIAKRLGTYQNGKTYRATVKYKAPVGHKSAIFFGDLENTDPYDNAVETTGIGTGQWKELEVIHTMSHDDNMFLLIYGQGNKAEGNYAIYDDLKIEEIQTDNKNDQIADNVLQETPVFALELREHDIYPNYDPEVIFSKEEDFLKIDSTEKSMGTTYAFRSFPRSFLKDKKLEITWETYSNTNDSDVIFYTLLLDDEYSRTSETDFPNEELFVPKGNGFLDLIDRRVDTTGKNSVTYDVNIDNAATNQLTLMVEMNEVWEATRTVTKIFDIKILDSENNLVAKLDTDGTVQMDTNNTLNDSGLFGADNNAFTNLIAEANSNNPLPEPPPSDTAVLQLNFDEGSGNQVASVNEKSYAIGTTTWTDGISGSALNFNGTSDLIDCGNDFSLNPKAANWTAAAWFKSDQGGRQWLIHHYRQTNGGGWAVEMNDGILSGIFYDVAAGYPAGYVATQSEQNYNDGEWHYVVSVWNKPSAKLYIDGVLVDEKTNNNIDNIATRNHCEIGGNTAYSNYYFHGDLDQIEIYNKALEEIEIVSLYEQIKQSGGLKPISCSAILNENPTASNGTYTIDPDGQGGENPFEVYCDMTGGGWTALPATFVEGVKGDLAFEGEFLNQNYTFNNLEAGAYGANWTGGYIVLDTKNLPYSEIKDIWHGTDWYGTAQGHDLVATDKYTAPNAFGHYNYHSNTNGFRKYRDTRPESGQHLAYGDTWIQKDWTGRYIYIACASAFGGVNTCSGQLWLKGDHPTYTKISTPSTPQDEAIFQASFDNDDNSFSYSPNNEIIGKIEGGAVPANEGISGQAMSFDGQDDLIVFPNISITEPESFSISWWIKPNNCTDHNQSLNIPGLFLFNTNKNCSAYLGTDKESRFVPGEIPDNTLEIGTWQNLVFTFENGTGKFYKNGELIAEKNDMTSPTAVTGFQLGLPYWNTIDGLFDELKIYNKSLSAEKVLQNYQELKSKAKLVLDLTFDEDTANTVLDSSGHNQNGSIRGEATFTEGVKGQALNLDGIDDYIELPLLTDNHHQGAVEAWIKIKDFDNEWMSIFSQGFQSINGKFITLDVYKSGILALRHLPQSNGIRGTTVLEPEKWYHVVLSGDGNNYKLYLNGQEEIFTLGDNSQDNGAWFDDFTDQPELNTIGGVQRLSNPFAFFSGAIDELKVYDQPLTAQEVVNHFQELQPENIGKGPTGQDENLILDFAFDEDSTLTVFDQSKNNHNGLIHGAANFVDGIRGRALNFDGENDFISINNGSNLLANSSAFTLSAWIYKSENTKDSADIYGQRHLATFYFDPGTDKLALFMKSGGTPISAIANTPVSNNQWHHVAITYDSSQIAFYLDGKLDATVAKAGPLGSNDEQAFINGSASADGGLADVTFWKGKIDELKIYNKSLSPEEILAQFQEDKLPESIDSQKLKQDLDELQAKISLISQQYQQARANRNQDLQKIIRNFFNQILSNSVWKLR